MAKVQIDSGLQLDPQDYVSEHINLGLTEIVYAWAKGVVRKKNERKKGKRRRKKKKTRFFFGIYLQ